MEVRLLGPVEVVVDGGRVRSLRAKERAVLAALALRAGEVVSEAALIDALWREDPPAAAAKALQTHVSRVRKALGAAGGAVETRPGGYRLSTDTVSMDVTRAETLLAEARQVDDLEAALGLLTEAGGLWRGPSLGDLATEAFAVGEAARLEELRLVIAEERIEAQLGLGRHAFVVGELDAACSAHPLRERLWCLLMLALYRAGRQAEALRTFQELRAHVGEELGLEPSAELVELDAAIARRDPKLAWEPRSASPRPDSPVPATGMAAGPSGTVTFLFTDVEGSTRLWEAAPGATRRALERHNVILRGAIEAHDGSVFATGGDSFAAAFPRAKDAVAAALVAQIALNNEMWPDEAAIFVRMGLHTGAAEQRGDDYLGPVLNRAARLMSAGHGAQVLLSAATQGLVRDELPAGCGLIELGEYRLRDLGRPERVFQLVHPDLPREFGRLRTLDAYPGNLPLQVSSLVGRDDDIERVSEALKATPVVTLTGVGGVGKTRLALQVAAEVLPRFRDGAWLCELQMVRDPGGVVDAVAAVFRVTARPGLSLDESLVVYLRDQDALIVLDNCEHLLRPVAGLVAKIEAACPGVRVLATSREGLNLRGEQILVVPSLAVPEGNMSVDSLTECDAVRLFIDRARAVKADFQVDAANAHAVGEVCRRLDGVPLAIELAAARVAAMNPAELARRLDRRFRLLTGGERVAIERHQTLRATIDWSYDLMSDPEKRLLARLSVFAGGCTLEAAEAVCGNDPIEVDEVLELLVGLVARSLVVADDAEPETRYRLLETIRQYGEERLAEVSETEACRVSHARYYGQLVGEVSSHIYGPGQREWGARLAREHDNLLLAMAYALDRQDVDLAMGLFCPVPFLSVQMNDLVFFDPTPILALPGCADHPGYADALTEAAVNAWNRYGDAGLALRLCDEAEVAERRHGRGEGWIGTARPVLRGQIAQAAGRTQEAIDHFLEGARTIREENPAIAAINFSSAAQTLGWIDPAAAQSLANEGLSLARQSGMPVAIVYNLEALAHVLATNEPGQAASLLTEALQLATTMGYEVPGASYIAAFTAARLGNWPVVLRTANRVLHDHIRTGAYSVVYVAAILNFVARSLAEERPESAAILQGTVTAMLSKLTPDIAPSVRGGGSDQNDVAAFVSDVRRSTTSALTSTLGENRMRELRAEGAAMDEVQACTFARGRIEELLGLENAPSQGC